MANGLPRSVSGNVVRVVCSPKGLFTCKETKACPNVIGQLQTETVTRPIAKSCPVASDADSVYRDNLQKD